MDVNTSDSKRYRKCVSQTAFIGREQKLAELKNYLDKAIKGGGTTVFITGEAGIGKTRLVEELISYAESKGVRCLRGNCIQMSEPYLPFSTTLSQFSKEPLFTEEEFISFKDVFAVNNAGLLLAHVSTAERDFVDDKIFSGMLTAVQDFVKDSFGDLEGSTAAAACSGGLAKLEYKDTKILIEHGRQIFLAGVIEGEEHSDMRKDLQTTVTGIEKNYTSILTRWDGDMTEVAGVAELIAPLTVRKYRVKKNLEGIKLENERFRIFERATNLVIELSKESPILIVIEDLHWADESSLLLLQYLARNTRTAAVSIVCTFRPEDLTEEQKKLLAKMAFEELYSKIELHPLAADDIVRMTQTIFSFAYMPKEFVNRLYESTHGNPFYTKEYLQTLYNEGIIQNINGNWQVGDVSQLTIPSSIAELISRRIDRLEDEEISIVEHAAIIGREFTTEFISRSLKIDLSSLMNYLGKLENYRIFRVKDREKGIYEFDHSIIRDVVYSEMSARWKLATHRRVGNTLEEIYKDNIDAVIYQLANHFSNTSERQKAIEYNIRAGDKAMDAFAADESARYYTTAIKIIGQSAKSEENEKKKLELFEKLGDIYVFAGKYEVGVGCYFDAIKIAEEFAEKLKISDLNRKIGSAYEKIGRFDKSLQYYDTALVPPAPHRALKAHPNLLKSQGFTTRLAGHILEKVSMKKQSNITKER